HSTASVRGINCSPIDTEALEEGPRVQMVSAEPVSPAGRRHRMLAARVRQLHNRRGFGSARIACGRLLLVHVGGDCRFSDPPCVVIHEQLPKDLNTIPEGAAEVERSGYILTG